MSGPAYHGWTHGVHGTDPIPVQAAGDFIFAPQQPADLFTTALVRNVSAGPGPAGTTNGAWGHIWIDTAGTLKIPGGCYLNNYRYNAFQTTGTATPSTPSSNVGDTLYFRFALGPVGSSWGVLLGLMSGPDYGILDLAVASVPDVVADTGRLDTWDNLNWLASPGLAVDAGEAAGVGQTAPVPDYLVQPWAFRLTGDPGTPATSWTGSTVNGGPGIYAVKLYVRGKNSLSTGYKAGIWSFAMNRLPLVNGFGSYVLDPS